MKTGRPSSLTPLHRKLVEVSDRSLITVRQALKLPKGRGKRVKSLAHTLITQDPTTYFLNDREHTA